MSGMRSSAGSSVPVTKKQGRTVTDDDVRRSWARSAYDKPSTPLPPPPLPLVRSGRALNNTEFRPRLPADPFGDTPWVLDVAALAPSSSSATSTTVLVLNTPPPADLAALLCASPA